MRVGCKKNCCQGRLALSSFFFLMLRPGAWISFLLLHQKKERKKNHRCMKFAENQRHSLNFGNSALWASNSPKFFTLISRFSIRKFHKAEERRQKAEGGR
jgi:hypothetical protein